MKTIQQLNEKWWYRLLKVVFLGVASLGAVISIFLIVDDYKPHQVLDYKISCIADYTNKKTLFAEKDAGLYFFPYGTETVYQSISDTDKIKLRKVCGYSDSTAEKLNSELDAYIEEQTKLGTDIATIIKNLESKRAYTIEEEYRTEGGYFEVIGYSLLAITIIVVVLEIIRRIFYYIVLGSIRPKK